MFNHLFLCFRAQVFISLAHVMRFISHNRLNSYLINNVKHFFMDRQEQRRCTRGDSSRTQTRNRKSPVTKKASRLLYYSRAGKHFSAPWSLTAVSTDFGRRRTPNRHGREENHANAQDYQEQRG